MRIKVASLFSLLKEPWVIALGVFIGWMGVQSAALSPLTPILISQVGGLDKIQITTYFIINIIVGISINLFTGWLSDGKVSRVVIIGVCGLTSTLGTVGLALGGPPWLLFIDAAFTASGFVLFPQLFALAHSLVMRTWPAARKTLGTTILRTAFSLGFVVGTGLASLLLLVLPLPSLFLTMALSGALLSGLSAIIVSRIEAWNGVKVARAPESNAETAAKDVPRVNSWGSLLLPLAAIALMQGADRVRMVYMPLVTYQLFHDARWAPMLFGVTAILELVTLVVVGALAVHLGEKWTIIAGASIGAVCFVVMAVFPTLSMMFAANVFYSFFIAALAGVGMAYIQRLLSHRPGLGGSLYLVTLNLGALFGVLAPLLVPGYSPMIFMLSAGLCVAGAFFLLRMRQA